MNKLQHQPSSTQLLDTKSAADVLHVKPETLTVWRCTKRYDLPFVKIGRKVFYDRRDLEAFIEKRKVTIAPLLWEE